MKMYGEEEAYHHYSLPQHYKEVSGQLHIPIVLPPRTEPKYPLYRRLGEPHS
jgi:hypothetical protein